MKILVFSDSHGSIRGIRRALAAHCGTIDAILHLGDGSADLDAIQELYPQYAYCRIAGNFEDNFSTDLLPETTLNFDNKKFFLTHGHRYGVKSGTSRLSLRAEALHTDIALFGHTHHPATISTPNHPILFNPGSIGTGPTPTYGIIQIVNGVIVTGHGKG